MESMEARLPPWRLFLPLCWMALIFWASGDQFSSLHTGQLLMPMLRSLWPSLPPGSAIQIHAFFRKGAHFLGYLLLSYFWLWSLRPRWSVGKTPILLALFLSLGYACFDEIHQAFIPSRTASLRDVLLDGSGAFFAQGLIWVRSLRSPSSSKPLL
jgi:VanZ family protein